MGDVIEFPEGGRRSVPAWRHRPASRRSIHPVLFAIGIGILLAVAKNGFYPAPERPATRWFRRYKRAVARVLGGEA